MKRPDFLTEWPFGGIVLTDHRTSLYHVMSHHKEGYTVEMLHELFPTLPVDLMEKVLAFAKVNQSEVDASLTRYKEELDEQYHTGRHLDIEELKRRWIASGRTGNESLRL